MTMATEASSPTGAAAPSANASSMSAASSPEPDAAPSEEAASIRDELRRIRGDLFDVTDADSSVALILSKVRELTDCENRVVEEQKAEIVRLRRELEDARQQEQQPQPQVNGGGVYKSVAVDADDDRPDGLESVPSFGSILSDSSSSIDTDNRTGFTNESERPTSYSIHTNQQLATRANLSQSIAMAAAELKELTSSKESVNEEVQGLEARLNELIESKESTTKEVQELHEQIQALLKERTKLIQEVEVYNDQIELAEGFEIVRESNERLKKGIEVLREAANRAEAQIDEARRGEELALQERDRARHEADELVQELDACREEMERIEQSANEVKLQAVREWEKAVHEKEVAEQKLAKELNMFIQAKEEAERESMARKEMEREIRRLYEEKIALEAELEDLRHGAAGGSSVRKVAPRRRSGPAQEAADIKRLKREIQALQGENASLRSMRNRDSEKIASLNDEVRSLRTHDRDAQSAQSVSFASETPQNTPVKGNSSSAQAAAASRKRALVRSRESVGEGEQSRECKRSIHYNPQVEGFGSEDGSGSLERIDGRIRERSDTGGSETVSALHEADNVSLLFGSDSVGQESVSGKSSKSHRSNDDEKSDHDEIRAHAEKLLYWANKASERSKRSDASVASRQGSQQGEEGAAQTPPRQSAIPKTIGLPPRSQSRVRKASPLPPRCPPAPSTASIGGDGTGSILSDKENGGAKFNRDRGADAMGAFPSLTPPGRQKKNVKMSENDNIIHNLDYVDESPVICCECSVSPFSGNDAQSEFYLPKLGMACACGATNNDREAFSKNPTALRNILRPWQCDFLATLDVLTADELLRAHKADANSMARSMKLWRMREGMAACRSRESYIALKIWSRTCKVVLRSIREQQELAGGEAEGEVVIHKPEFLDITFADTHTIASISTLGQLSSVGGGGRPFEMMEI